MPEGSNFLLSNHSRLQIIWHHLERALRMSYKILIHSQDTDSRVSKKIIMWKKRTVGTRYFEVKQLLFTRFWWHFSLTFIIIWILQIQLILIISAILQILGILLNLSNFWDFVGFVNFSNFNTFLPVHHMKGIFRLVFWTKYKVMIFETIYTILTSAMYWTLIEYRYFNRRLCLHFILFSKMTSYS